jgi:hypothetical protein
MDASDSGGQPGRVCPLDYRTDPASLARAPDIVADTVYVVGGLYGNAFALDAIEALAAAEPWPVSLVLNGDAHWFDAEPGIFRRLDVRLARYPATTGNIEFELARQRDAGAGCGCAYPPQVADDVVERSNMILARLKNAIGTDASILERLGALPKALLADVGGCRVGIVHGDPTSVAGWGFAAEGLDDPASLAWLDAIKRASRVDVFASTHTCGAVMRDFRLLSGRLIVANNGAAGMGNFDVDQRGLITRVSTRPSPHAVLYGLRWGAAHVDALPIAFDLDAFAREFDAIWQPGSPAERSYRKRIHGQFAGADLRSAMPAVISRQRGKNRPESAPARAATPMQYQAAAKSGEPSDQ